MTPTTRIAVDVSRELENHQAHFGRQPPFRMGRAKQLWERVYPAKGIATYKGKPLSGAMITLVAVTSDQSDLAPLELK